MRPLLLINRRCRGCWKRHLHLCGGRHVLHCHFNQLIHDSIEIVRLFVDLQLHVRGSSSLQDCMNVVNLFSRSQLINYVVDKLQQLQNQTPDRNFRLLAKIDHFAVESITNGAPLVFLNQHTSIQSEPKVLVDKRIQLRDNRLEKSSNGKRIVDARGNVTNAELQRWEKRMRANVPPDLFAVVDATRLHKEINVSLKSGVGVEVIWNISSGKLFEDLCAVRL